MSLVTVEQVEQFQREGYFILESAIPANVVEALQDECMRHVEMHDREMEAKGVTTQGITHYKKRYFISNRSADSPIMTDFLFSELMAEICRATLGDTAYLFHEQYVVKAADSRQQVRLAPRFRLRGPLSPRLSVLLVRVWMICRSRMARCSSCPIHAMGGDTTDEIIRHEVEAAHQ